MEIRELRADEVDRLWSIDRSERIERVYRRKGDALRVVPERHEVTGWPPGEAEKYGPLLRDCLEHGGRGFAAFEDGALVGAAILEGRFIGRRQDRLQLKFLHVSQRRRGTGLGRRLFALAVARARELGARQLYVSATTTENTVRFYLNRGCHLAREVDPALHALEPDDIHLELDLAEGEA